MGSGDISEALLAELDDATKAQGLGGLLNEIQHREDGQRIMRTTQAFISTTVKLSYYTAIRMSILSLKFPEQLRKLNIPHSSLKNILPPDGGLNLSSKLKYLD